MKIRVLKIGPLYRVLLDPDFYKGYPPSLLRSMEAEAKASGLFNKALRRAQSKPGVSFTFDSETFTDA